MDFSFGPVSIGIGFPFFGATKTSLYVNVNGALTFNGILNAYTPKCTPMTGGYGIVMTYWSDIDTSYTPTTAHVWYRETTSADVIDKATIDISNAFPTQFCNIRMTWAFVTTWHNVTFYNYKCSQPRQCNGNYDCAPRNTFQCVLTTDGVRSFAIFYYNNITWTTGCASGCSSTCTGLGGNPARVGFDAGDGVNYKNAPNACTSNIVNIDTTSNVGTSGMLVYRIDMNVNNDPEQSSVTCIPTTINGGMPTTSMTSTEITTSSTSIATSTSTLASLTTSTTTTESPTIAPSTTAGMTSIISMTTSENLTTMIPKTSTSVSSTSWTTLESTPSTQTNPEQPSTTRKTSSTFFPSMSSTNAHSMTGKTSTTESTTEKTSTMATSSIVYETTTIDILPPESSSTDIFVFTSPNNEESTIDYKATVSYITDSPMCECNADGFRLISDHLLTSAQGKFSGYFTEISPCEQTCRTNYGLIPCIGYFYEPNNLGKCIIFQYAVNTDIQDFPNGSATLYVKCDEVDQEECDGNIGVTPETMATTNTPSNCMDGFRLVANNILTNATGKFGGYFSSSIDCQTICAQDYGLLRCIGYLYEPYNRGKCTIFQYTTGSLTADAEGADLYVKCSGNTPTEPIVTTSSNEMATDAITIVPTEGNSIFEKTTPFIESETTTLAEKELPDIETEPVTSVETLQPVSEPPLCSCDSSGFQLISNYILTGAQDKFGGYFDDISMCEELCRRDYGLLPCIGYFYEPSNRGKCTIFQYSISTFSEDPGGDASIFVKCDTISEDQCGAATTATRSLITTDSSTTTPLPDFTTDFSGSGLGSGHDEGSTTPNPTSSLTPRTTSTPGECIDGFQLVANNILTNGTGKFGGYFMNVGACEEVCSKNYGLVPCIGFMYEANSRGKCTIFQYTVGSFTRDQQGVMVYVKCNSERQTTRSSGYVTLSTEAIGGSGTDPASGESTGEVHEETTKLNFETGIPFKYTTFIDLAESSGEMTSGLPATNIPVTEPKTTERMAPLMATTLRSNNPPSGSCIDGFRLVDNHTSYVDGSGKFGGYFTHRSDCEELCRRDYGLLRCIGYFYHPLDRGKCIIFQYGLSGISSDPRSEAVAYEKC